MELWIVSFLFLGFQLVSVNSEIQYKAAVYEHKPHFWPLWKIPSREKALHIMKKNLDIYREQAAKAKEQGAQIIVFPEDGIYGFLVGGKRSQVFPFLEDIPDPSTNWNPCKDRVLFRQTEVLQYLSCIALNNSIAVVANMGDVKKCKENDPNCPTDGRYQYNTDVAFDTDGRLIARYHKQHLYRTEIGFNTPETCEKVNFTTSFGVNFGVFTCFDILYTDPAMELVDEGVCDIVFPTAWMDGLPLLAAVQFQQAFSRQTCTNFLAANLHFPCVENMHGSGIYSCGDAKNYIYDETTWNGHLVVASLPAMKKNCKKARHQYQNKYFSLLPQYPPQRFSNRSSKSFQSSMLDDKYTFKYLNGPPGGHLEVCSEDHEFCCRANYSIESSSSAASQEEKYAFGVFNGHHNEDQYFLQVCALIKCAGQDQKSCGRPVKKAQTQFSSFEINGNFSSKATVFPEVLLSNVELVSAANSIKFDGDSLISAQPLGKPLLSAVLFGRVYSKDKK